MQQHIAHIAILVRDYDEAIAFYTEKLHFKLIEDKVLSPEKRWVLVQPCGKGGTAVLLAKAASAEQEAYIGRQTGGRVFLFLYTDNFERDYQNLLDQHIRIVRLPSVAPYGTVAVFEDLYGNLWDLIEPVQPSTPFYSTGILRIKNSLQIQQALEALQQLKMNTLQEPGCISFDVHQSREEPTQIILWECFREEADFIAHLQAKHVQDFLQQGWVDFDKGYTSSRRF
ncbi:MAG: VOC family protein [Nitritalea sp.]